MKIAIGGLKKNEVKEAVLKALPDAEVTVTTDIAAVPLMKNGSVDYYFGACESGGGAAISILIGMLGYSKCCTVCKNGKVPNKDEIIKFIKEGKVAFGMSIYAIDSTVPVLIEALLEAKS